MTTRDRRREDDDDAEVSFEGIVDLGSMPPPASGQVDVHRAPTAVSTMTDELVAEIQRAREEAKLLESQKTRIQPKFQAPEDAAVAGFQDETPTRPGKDKDSTKTKRPSAPDLHEALPPDPAIVIRTPAPGTLPPIPPVVSFAETIPRAPAPIATATRTERAWPRLLFWVVTLAAVIVTALAARRFRDRLHR